MERELLYKKEELHSISYAHMNTAYENQRKMLDASSAFGLGQYEALDVQVNPEICDHDTVVWYVVIGIKQYYPSDNLISLLNSSREEE